jgi:hypothetical protein
LSIHWDSDAQAVLYIRLTFVLLRSYFFLYIRSEVLVSVAIKLVSPIQILNGLDQ